MPKKTICVFCGSRHGLMPQYAVAAERLGGLIATSGFDMLYGGGGPGLMGETAKAAAANGAHVRGVLPDFLRGVEKPPEWELDLVITPDLQLRKTQMLAESDAFVILPGGPGTMDEFFEVVTSAQLHALLKPIVLVNVAGFFDPLQALMQHLVAQGFADESLLSLYSVVDTPEQAIALISDKLGAGAGG